MRRIGSKRRMGKTMDLLKVEALRDAIAEIISDEVVGWIMDKNTKM